MLFIGNICVRRSRVAEWHCSALGSVVVQTDAEKKLEEIVSQRLVLLGQLVQCEPVERLAGQLVSTREALLVGTSTSTSSGDHCEDNEYRCEQFTFGEHFLIAPILLASIRVVVKMLK